MYVQQRNFRSITINNFQRLLQNNQQEHEATSQLRKLQSFQPMRPDDDERFLWFGDSEMLTNTYMVCRLNKLTCDYLYLEVIHLLEIILDIARIILQFLNHTSSVTQYEARYQASSQPYNTCTCTAVGDDSETSVNIICP